MNKLIIFISVFIALAIFFTLSSSENPDSLDFLWSKGLKEKDSYCLRHTEKRATQKEINDISKKPGDIKWIRSCDIETFSKSVDFIKDEIILVTGDGDLSIPEDIDIEAVEKIVNCKKITKWLTQNYTLNNYDKIKPYPIGFDLHTFRGYSSYDINRLSAFFVSNNPEKTYKRLKSLKIPEKRKLEIFCDVHLLITHPDRKEVYDMLKDEPHFKPLKGRVKIETLWEKYREYQFVISTKGNGLDCHRTWEIIYNGGIVITKTSSLDSLYENLPVVIVQDWEECKDVRNLEIWKEKFKNMTSKEYLEPFFKYDYWIKR